MQTVTYIIPTGRDDIHGIQVKGRIAYDVR